MKRGVLVLLVMVLCTLGVEAQEIQKWAIMVEKAELYSEPSVTSPIVGYVKKSEGSVIGELNRDGSWLHVKKSGSGASGWVLSCVSVDAAQADNTNGFDYEACYKINKEFAEGKISQERFAAMLNNLHNNRDVNYGMNRYKENESGGLEERWIASSAAVNALNMVIAILVLGAIAGYALRIFLGIRLPIVSNISIMLLLLGIVEVLYMIHPYGVGSVDFVNTLILILVQLLLIRGVVNLNRHGMARSNAFISLACLVVVIIIYICNVGIVDFIGILVDTVLGSILMVGLLVVIGIIIYGAVTAPASSGSADSPKDLPEVCKFCRHFDRSSGVCYMDIDNPKRKNPNHDTCSRFDWY